MAASLGLDTVGLDSSPRAIAQAETKATDRGLGVRFVVGDALDLPGLGELFDTVIDCGLFHVFNDEERERFVASLAGVMTTGGHYFMLCFSDRQPGDFGPRRVTQAVIRTSFADGWRVESIEPAILDLTRDPAGALAWLATIERT
jgi:cyclopropane fatty-acyl-phospholipid synthase-like methyltransferase